MRDKKFSAVWIFVIATMLLIGWASLTSKMPTHLTSKMPTQKVTHEWTRADSLSFALDQLQAEADRQFVCLQNLWGKESGWNPKAKNLVKSQGLNAGGIPQLLGLSPLTPPSQQIRRGLIYIFNRYATPCIAWQKWQRRKWY